MLELSNNEKIALNHIKEDYDKKQTNPIPHIEPKIEVKIEENCLASLQEKGYIDVNKSDLDPRLELIKITLKDKFFQYFNIV